MTKPRAGRKPADDEVRIAGVVITHPHKVMWPASGGQRAITKLDLARYYTKVAPRMLPHIAGRPVSLVRAPDGIAGEKFFQRHSVAGARDIRVRGQAGLFLGVKGRKGLIALSKAAALEIHPWGTRPDDPDTPERIIFDLDPSPDLNFARVVEAARMLRAPLRAGICAFRQDHRWQGPARRRRDQGRQVGGAVLERCQGSRQSRLPFAATRFSCPLYRQST